MKIECKNIDEYMALQPEQKRAFLNLLRQTIKKAAPEATESISYRMPLFKFHGILAYFAAFENHYGLYVLPEVLQVFKDKFKGYKLAKATIQFPINEPLPEKLVTELIKYAVQVNLERKFVKEAAKKQKRLK